MNNKESDELKGESHFSASRKVILTSEDIDKSICDIFFKVADIKKNDLSLISESGVLTYTQMQRRVRQFSRCISGSSSQKSARIIIALDLAIDIVPAILGTLMLGKIYVPVDSQFPVDRIRYIVSDTEPDAIILNRHCADMIDIARVFNVTIIYLENVYNSEPLYSSLAVSSDSAASILYTSGSGGYPKGVLQNHRNIIFHVFTLTSTFKISDKDRHSGLSSFIFDGSTTDMFCALLNGGVFVTADLHRTDFFSLGRILSQYEVSLYHSTPTVFRELVKSLPEKYIFESIRLVVLGGEVVNKSDLCLFRKHFSDCCVFVNGYGATETGGFVALNIMSKTDKFTNDIVPIGVAPDGVEILFRNSEGEAADNEGEIVIKSRHVSLGYWNNEKATRKAFKSDPFNRSVRCYYTGDSGRKLHDGKIVHLGRLDRVVKIRGYRVELTEIESALLSNDEVKSAASFIYSRGEDYPDQLVSFVSTYSPGGLSSQSIRNFLNKKLPFYMIPSRITPIDDMPLTTSRKIDYKKLALLCSWPTFSGKTPDFNNTTESVIGDIWCEVIGTSISDADQNFFDSGGDSVLMSRVHEKMIKKIGFNFPLFRLFQYPTIRSAAEFIESSRKSEAACGTSEDSMSFDSMEKRMRSRSDIKNIYHR